MNDETAKLLVREAVSEAGIEAEFLRHLEDLRRDWADVKATGEREQAGYVLALAYFSAEIQNEQ